MLKMRVCRYPRAASDEVAAVRPSSPSDSAPSSLLPCLAVPRPFFWVSLFRYVMARPPVPEACGGGERPQGLALLCAEDVRPQGLALLCGGIGGACGQCAEVWTNAANV